jgi:hypothetical protein
MLRLFQTVAAEAKKEERETKSGEKKLQEDFHSKL